MRRSLLLRLLILSLAVALAAIAATAALVTFGATEHLRAQAERSAPSIEIDGQIHAALTDYARGHSDWDGVRELVAQLSSDYGRRVALTATDGTVIADSAGSDPNPPDLPGKPAARVDVARSPEGFAVAPVEDIAYAGDIGPSTSQVAGSPDQFVSVSGGPGTLAEFGPQWRLTEAEVEARRAAASRSARCLSKLGLGAEVLELHTQSFEVVVDGHAVGPAGTGLVVSEEISPEAFGAAASAGGGAASGGRDGRGAAAGRTVPTEKDVAAGEQCIDPELNEASQAAKELNSDLVRLTGRCLDEGDIEYRRVELGNGLATVVPTTDVDLERAACFQRAQETALSAYVPPAADLYLGGAEPFNALAGEGLWRTIAMAVGVLLAAAVVTVAAGRRMARPIAALTGAAQRMAAGERSTRVAVSGGDEIARLGSAFNVMAESVAEQEERRRAMVSDVAHELRNPLSTITGYLEAADDGIVELDAELVRSLQEEAALLGRLVTDLQELALADAGKLGLHRTDCDLAELAEQVVAGQRQRADEADVALAVRAPEPVRAEVDPGRIRQVVGNLVDNALTYTTAGGSVEIRVAAEADVMALVEVVDTGTGIAPVHLPHVFDRLYRADPSRSRETGGSGLGLAIVQKLVESHGGTIAVTSTEGEGTTFTVRLPTSPPSGE